MLFSEPACGYCGAGEKGLVLATYRVHVTASTQAAAEAFPASNLSAITIVSPAIYSWPSSSDCLHEPSFS